MNTPNFYQQVATATRTHLGPAAERFVARQIRGHLKKEPAMLTTIDLQKLIDWIELSMRTIYSDQQSVDVYIHDLRTRIEPKTKRSPIYDEKPRLA